jgi:hypothetical protein
MKFIKRKNIDTYRPKSQKFTVEVDGRAIIDTDKSLTLPIGETANRPTSAVPGMLRYNTSINDFEVFTDYADWGWEKLRTDRPSDIEIQNVGTGSADGSINTVIIKNGGSGYITAPSVLISEPDVGNNFATVSAVVSEGVITSVEITNFGSGYTTTPIISIIGENQTAELEVVLTGQTEFQLPSNINPVDSFGNVSSSNIQVYIENVLQLPEINYIVVKTNNIYSVRFDSPVPNNQSVYVIHGYDR